MDSLNQYEAMRGTERPVEPHIQAAYDRYIANQDKKAKRDKWLERFIVVGGGAFLIFVLAGIINMMFFRDLEAEERAHFEAKGCVKMGTSGATTIVSPGVSIRGVEWVCQKS